MLVVNGAGSTSSPYASILTLEAPPTSVLPPTARVNPDQLYIIYLTWGAPDKPNGKTFIIKAFKSFFISFFYSYY